MLKRTVPLLITAVVGFLLILHYFVPRFSDWADIAAVHFDILAAIAFILGGGNLLRTHGEKVYKRQSGWGYSVVAVVSFLTMLTIGLFKIGAPADRGFWTQTPMRSGETVGVVTLDRTAGGAREFNLVVRRAPPGTTQNVVVGDQLLGRVEIDDDGRGSLTVESGADEQASIAAVLLSVESGAKVHVGEGLLAGELVAYSRILGIGNYNEDGSAFWFLYEYGFQPLQQTTFAMLAFYVASAAFRAFRARNIDSVLLLGTAFVILLGRTFVGTVMTMWLPDTGFWSFFQVPNLTGWIMSVFNTAGNRAIMIGIALGVASTSLKVLLGIERSYLGSDKG